VVTKELLQKGDSLNQNIQLFHIDFCFGDFTNNPESRVFFINLAGDPAHTSYSGMFFVITDPAPMTEPSPMVTLERIVVLAPM
jgi:hypothetical protein